MSINKEYIDLFHMVSVKAALATYKFVGKKDKIAADKAAVDSMRSELNKIEMKGQVVIGEGALDEAPLLYTGENLGTQNGPSFDIAVDPTIGDIWSQTVLDFTTPTGTPLQYLSFYNLVDSSYTQSGNSYSNVSQTFISQLPSNIFLPSMSFDILLFRSFLFLRKIFKQLWVLLTVK